MNAQMNECNEIQSREKTQLKQTLVFCAEAETESSSQLVGLFTKIALWNYTLLLPF
jgi:hypothetical protein